MDTNNYTGKITVEQVTNSIECIRCRRFVKFYATMAILMLLELAALLYIISIRDDLYHRFEVSCILCAVFGFTFILMIWQIVYNVRRIKSVESGVGSLPVYKVVFENVRSGFWNGTRLVVEIPDGNGKTAETRPMFVTQKPANLTAKPRTFIPTLYVDDFIGREVLVMHNPENNKLYLLGLADNFALPTDNF